jgi:nucleoside-diphosphate-sugar epimerase
MGTLILPKGKLGVEESVIDYDDAMNVRAKSEKEVDILAAQGVRASVVRLSPTVHGPGDLAFINMLAQIARGNGEAAYIGNGLNRWPAVHRLDAARLFRLAVEKGVAGGRYHAAAEEGIPFKNIAEALGQSLGLPVVSKTPEEAPAYFRGFIAALAGVDNPTSSKKTQETLGWKPSESTLLEDIKSGLYNDAKSTSLSV